MVRVWVVLVGVLAVVIGFGVWVFKVRRSAEGLPGKPRTVEQVVRALKEPIRGQLGPAFRNAGVAYPPKRVVLRAFKTEKELELLAADEGGELRKVLVWPILAASGTTGPKLREGDGQVPEGFYRIELLNPNSSYHLSLRVDYPNAEDLAHAAEEGRDRKGLGGDIMIHGKAMSAGCLAIGDRAVEELFVLAALTGLDAIELQIFPGDFRKGVPPAPPDSAPAWTGELHERLRVVLGKEM